MNTMVELVVLISFQQGKMLGKIIIKGERFEPMNTMVELDVLTTALCLLQYL